MTTSECVISIVLPTTCVFDPRELEENRDFCHREREDTTGIGAWSGCLAAQQLAPHSPPSCPLTNQYGTVLQRYASRIVLVAGHTALRRRLLELQYGTTGSSRTFFC
jgi:hypothetical protein